MHYLEIVKHYSRHQPLLKSKRFQEGLLFPTEVNYYALVGDQPPKAYYVHFNKKKLLKMYIMSYTNSVIL